MLITYFGIILFPLVGRIKFIKLQSPVKMAQSLQVTGREVAHTSIRQRHEASLKPVLMKSHWNIKTKPHNAKLVGAGEGNVVIVVSC